MKNSKHSIMHFILRFITVIPLCYQVINRFVHLVEQEANLAKRKVIVLLIASIMLLALFASTWLCLIGMIFLYLVSLHLSYLVALFLVFILNLLLLIVSGLIILNIKNEPLFPKTREIIFHSKE